MNEIISRSWLQFTAFLLCCFLNVILNAQDNGPEAFYSAQRTSSSKVNIQKTDTRTTEAIFRFYQPELEIVLPDVRDTFLPNPSNLPLLRNENAEMQKKIGRAELLIGGAELVGITALILLPKEVTKWSDGWAQDAWRNMKRSLSRLPVWDDDDWQLNYIGHPIAGSYYYNSLRSQNASIFHSFLFATVQSFIWEYFIEATAEKPSTQDLIVTPIAGAILGESAHRLTMNMRRNGFNFLEKVFVVLLNPMFVINNGLGSRFNPVKPAPGKK